MAFDADPMEELQIGVVPMLEWAMKEVAAARGLEPHGCCEDMDEDMDGILAAIPGNGGGTG